MKRDMDLVRDILRAIENLEDSTFDAKTFDHLSHPPAVINYHLGLLVDARLAEGTCDQLIGRPPDWYVTRLTWEGHEFLDAARNDTIWAKAKKKTLDATGGISLSLLKEVLFQLAKQAVGFA